MQNKDLQDSLKAAARLYPQDMVAEQILDIPRISFNISIALDAVKPKPHNELALCDLGGGIGLFSIACATYGLKRTVLVDDFDDSVNHRLGSSILDLHKGQGVEVIECNVVDRGMNDIPGTFDLITSFDSMEHWHHSPKQLFHQIVERLNPGGAFVLGVPNCVNLRKRITVPFGYGKWSTMQGWYEEEKFRGHVREPDVSDLLYIADDMGLSNVRTYGRNWLGYNSSRTYVRLATRMIDYPLRYFPALCSDIYLVGTKA